MVEEDQGWPSFIQVETGRVEGGCVRSFGAGLGHSQPGSVLTGSELVRGVQGLSGLVRSSSEIVRAARVRLE